MVANSPRIGVGPGFDSQGCVTFLSQILLSQLVLNPLGHSFLGEVIRPSTPTTNEFKLGSYCFSSGEGWHCAGPGSQ